MTIEALTAAAHELRWTIYGGTRVCATGPAWDSWVWILADRGLLLGGKPGELAAKLDMLPIEAWESLADAIVEARKLRELQAPVQERAAQERAARLLEIEQRLAPAPQAATE